MFTPPTNCCRVPTIGEMQMSTEITSALLSDELCEKIQNYVTSQIKATGKRAVARDLICTGMKEDVGQFERSHFKTALSLSVKEGRLPLLEMKTGKAGGLGLRTVKSDPVPTVNKKILSEKTVVFFGGKEHIVNMSMDKTLAMFTKVFDLSRDPDGELTIGDYSYAIDDEKTRMFVENCLYYFAQDDLSSDSQAA